MEIGMNPNRVLEELARHQLVDGYPMVADLERSEGIWLHDAASGERYMDAFTCFASMPLGFNHPGMNDSGFLDTLRRAALCNVSNADIYSCEMADFVDTFATHASPEGFNHHFWIAGGGLAVENAMKAAFDWKARRLGRTNFEDNCDDLKIMHFRQAFHGRTGYTMSVTNTIPDKVGLFPKFPWPRIHNPACQFDLDGNICNDVEAEEAKACAEIEAALGSGKNDIAGILIEPMQGEGGDNHFRPEFMAKLRTYADEGDALLLYDEVQTGFFGSGKPWFWQHQGIQPDVVSFGKKAQVCGIYAGPKVDEVKYLRDEWRNVRSTVNDFDFHSDSHDDAPMRPTLASARRGVLAAADWYVFEAGAGTRMPTDPPGDRTCGTLEAGWLATSHPSRGDAPLSGPVCFGT